MSNSLRDKTAVGVIWSSLERFSIQGVHFLVTLVMARILTPKDFGLVGMLAVFIQVAQSLIDSGFSQALIRKQDRCENDNNTVFYFNVLVSFFVYLVLYFLAPYIADFYNESFLCLLMRVLCLVIIFNSFAVVQRALFTANVNFKVQAKATLTAAVLSGVIGIYMAYSGYGVWALIGQQLSSSIFNTLLIWYFSSWRPKLLFSWLSFKQMYAFGFNLMLAGIFETIYQNSYQIMIGKFFSAASLGQFTQAKSLSRFPSSNIAGILGRVTYPVLSKIQNDTARLSFVFRKFSQVICYWVFPVMCTLAALSKPIVHVLIGHQWDFAAVLIVPLSFSFMFYPLHGINMSLLQARGNSKTFLKAEVIKKCISISFLVATIPFGIIVMCYGRVVSSFFTMLVNMYYSSKEIKLDVRMLIKDFLPSLAMSILSYFIVLALTTIVEGDTYQLLLGGFTSVVVYFLCSYVLKRNEFQYTIQVLKIKSL